LADWASGPGPLSPRRDDDNTTFRTYLVPNDRPLGT